MPQGLLFWETLTPVRHSKSLSYCSQNKHIALWQTDTLVSLGVYDKQLQIVMTDNLEVQSLRHTFVSNHAGCQDCIGI